jgi:hypothetical protein
MKIAVLISGEYRKLDVCSDTMTFLRNHDVDVYVSTWDKTIYSNKKINLYVEEEVTEGRIRQDLNRQAAIRIDPHNSFVEEKYNSKMINRWLAGFELIKNSNIKYDYVVITRPDLFFNKGVDTNFNSLSEYDNTIGFAWATSLHLEKLPDLFYVSTYANIEKLFSSLKIEDWATAKGHDWHIWWYFFVYGLFPDVKSAPEFGHFTFCRLWGQTNHTFLEMLDIHHDWRDLRLLQSCDMWGEEFAKTAWPDHILIEAKEKWARGYFERYKSNHI